MNIASYCMHKQSLWTTYINVRCIDVFVLTFREVGEGYQGDEMIIV